MALSDRRNKDQAMAASLKAKGIERTPTKGSQRCCICNSIVQNAAFYHHIAVHK